MKIYVIQTIDTYTQGSYCEKYFLQKSKAEDYLNYLKEQDYSWEDEHSRIQLVEVETLD